MPGHDKGAWMRPFAVCSFTDSGSASGGEAAAAPAPAARIRIAEGEAGSLHRRSVIDGYAAQVLRAETIHEDAHAVDGNGHVIFDGLFFDVQAVLEAGASAGQHADPEARGLRRHLLGCNELPDLFRGTIRNFEGEPRRGSLLLGAAHAHSHWKPASKLGSRPRGVNGPGNVSLGPAMRSTLPGRPLPDRRRSAAPDPSGNSPGWGGPGC